MGNASTEMLGKGPSRLLKDDSEWGRTMYFRGSLNPSPDRKDRLQAFCEVDRNEKWKSSSFFDSLLDLRVAPHHHHGAFGTRHCGLHRNAGRSAGERRHPLQCGRGLPARSPVRADPSLAAGAEGAGVDLGAAAAPCEARRLAAALLGDPAPHIFGAPGRHPCRQLHRARKRARTDLTPQRGLRDRYEREHLTLAQEARVGQAG